jgi:hypothetical protein
MWQNKIKIIIYEFASFGSIDKNDAAPCGSGSATVLEIQILPCFSTGSSMLIDLTML